MKIGTLKLKVLMWFIGIIFMVLFVFSFALYYFIHENITLKIESNLKFTAKEIYNNIEKNNYTNNILENENIKNFDIAIIKDKQIINKTKWFKQEDFQQYLYKNKKFFFQEVDENTINAIYVLNFDIPFQGAIVIIDKNIPNKLENIQDVLLTLDPILLLILVFVGSRLVDKILIPIKDITQSAKRISINDLSDNIITVRKEEELQELVQTFNMMITRLKDGVDKLERFNSDVSHELRTPLTVINTQTELALKKDRDIAYYKDSLRKIANESDKINHIVQDMLLLTRYTKDIITQTYMLCDFNAILIDSVDKFADFADGKNISIELLRFEKTICKANQSLIAILFSNLLDNAIKYTPENKHIFLSLFMENDTVNFIIKDEGIGIPQDSLGKVTDRFYRVDESRNKSIKGFGLGLSLAQNIVDLHQGSMKIESIEDGGTTITLIMTLGS